jgi:hypothetical protein
MCTPVESLTLVNVLVNAGNTAAIATVKSFKFKLFMVLSSLKYVSAGSYFVAALAS